MNQPAGDFEFLISAEQADNGYVIHVSGDIDLANTPALAAHLEPTPKSVTIDLGGCTYFGSSAAAILVATISRGAEITLRHVPVSVQRVLDITGIATKFRHEE